MLKKSFAIIISLVIHIHVLYGSVLDIPPVEKSFRFLLINPGVEWQLPVGNNSLLLLNPAFGYGGSFPNLSRNTPSGFLYDLSPKLTIQHLWFYNRAKWSERGRDFSANSGNFISLRIYSRGPSVASNFTRYTDLEFAVGPTWGIQRTYGQNLSLFFDVGPVYYFDIEGNHGFFPVLPRISLGWIIK